MRVLVVEDYDPIRESVVQGLQEADFAVDSVGDGKEALNLASSFNYDVIVLDLMLPGMSGMEVVKQLRENNNNACVLVLSARDHVDDRVAGLRAGADDYLIKPFAFAELLARVETLVRRRYNSSNPVITIADLVINTASKTAMRGDCAIELTSREYNLLEYLARRTGEVVARADIWEHLYDYPEDSQSNVVDVYVGYLRKKIEMDGKPKLLKTRRGQGYILGDPS